MTDSEELGQGMNLPDSEKLIQGMNLAATKKGHQKGEPKEDQKG